MEITKTKILEYKRKLESMGLSPSTVKRRMAAVRKFCFWATEKGYLRENPFASRPLLEKLGAPKGVVAKIRQRIRRLPPLPTLSNIYEIYHSISITRYLHWAILIIFCAALGFGAYDQFFRRAPTPMAYPTTLTPPKRYLSFQGRLTDSSGNPITSATNMVFKLYNVSSGGTALWNSGSCTVSPDTDGIFSLILGTTSGDNYSCPSASEIDASVFSENPEVWLGITVGTDAEMTPRIQIATVGYALNAETLQGFPPASPAATNTIPIVNSDGNIIIAAASPAIKSTSGTFGIQGQALTLTTATGTNGNITLAPNGSGVINLTLSAGTGNVLNATDAQLGASGQKEENTLFYGKVANDNTNFNLLKLESGSSPTPKFTVDASGNASAAGNLRVLGSGNNYFAGNVGIGTTNPTSKLHVEGQCVTGDTLLPIVRQEELGIEEQRGEIWPDRSNATSSHLNPLEYRRESRETIKTGIQALSPYEQGVFERTQHSHNDFSGSRLHNPNTIPNKQAENYESYQKNLSSDFQPSSSNLALSSITYVPIKDIKGGEYVLSLNEQTGKIEPHRIKGLLDMGVQPVYKLTTEDGRTIRTTGNHPYLVRSSLFESDIHKENNNQEQSVKNASAIKNVLNINSHFASSANLMAINNESIPNGRLVVNRGNNSIKDLTPAKPGEIKITANQPAERLVSNSERTESRGLVNNFFISNNITNNNSLVNGQWTKVVYLQPGMEIAVADENYRGIKWVKIKAIEELPPEQVYDIEVEGTHNFVANGIIAHNTYISGNLGIGTSSPSQNLHISGNMRLTGAFYDVNNEAGNSGQILSSTGTGVDWVDITSIGVGGSGTENYLPVWLAGGHSLGDSIIYQSSGSLYLPGSGIWNSSGNVGIGTTNPGSYKLYVAGNQYVSGNLTTSGTITAGSTLYLPDGSASSPALTFTNDTNTGLYRLAADKIGLITGGVATQGITIDSSGNVGIGTVDPGSYKLYVAGNQYNSGGLTLGGDLRLNNNQILNSNGTATIIFSSTPSTSWNILDAGAWQVYNTANVGQAALAVNQLMGGDIFTASASGQPKFVITNAGNVGIGTAAPYSGYKLHVVGNLGIGDTPGWGAPGMLFDYIDGGTGEFRFRGIRWNEIFRWGHTASGYNWVPTMELSGNVLSLYNNNSAPGSISIQFHPQGGNSFINSGNVGIGTTAPKDKLDINGNYARGSKTIAISSTRTPILSIDLGGDHRAAHVRIFYGGLDWPYHSGARYEAEFHIIDGGGSYGEPGDIIFQHSNTPTDAIQARLTHIDPNTVNIELRTVDIEGDGFSGGYSTLNGILTYEVEGNFASIGFTTGTITTSNDNPQIFNLRGNVGIGTTSPGARLDVAGTIRYANGTQEIKIEGASADSTAPRIQSYQSKPLFINELGNNVIINANGGSVGIGTTGPQNKLEIAGDGIIGFSSVPTGYPLRLRTAGPTDSNWGIEQANQSGAFGGIGARVYGGTGQGFYVRDVTNNVYRFVVEGGTGNVGIGTTAPGAKLEVLDNSSTIGRIRVVNDYGTTGNQAELELTAENTSGTALTWFIINYRASSGSLNFWDGTQDLMRIQPGASGNILGNNSFVSNAFDLAENVIVNDTSIEAGDIVIAVPTTSPSNWNQKYNTFIAAKTQTPYAKEVIGIISEKPGFLMRGYGFDEENQVDQNFVRPLSLSGRVPVKISTINGPIKIGDPITSSNIPGVGMKATKAGFIVGRALENYSNPDPNAVDKILVMLSLSWYDPDVYLTSTGDLQIVQTDENGKDVYDGNLEKIRNSLPGGRQAKFEIRNSLGEVIDRVGAFAEIAVAKIKTGIIQTADLISQNLIASKANIDNLITNSLTSDKIVSPLVETEEVNTQRIKLSEIETASESGEIAVSDFGKLIFKGKEDQEVASIDNQGNATFSGTVTSDQLSVTGEATIGATLYADRLVAKEIVGLKGTFGELLTATVSAEKIQGLEERLAQLEEKLKAGEVVSPTPSPTPMPEILPTEAAVSPTPTPTPEFAPEPEQTLAILDALDSSENASTSSSAEEASAAGKLSPQEIERMVNEILTSAAVGPASESADLNVYSHLAIQGDLTVLGTATLAEAFVTSSVNVGGNLVLEKNAINTFFGPLYIQNLGLGGVDILAGKITIDRHGNAVFSSDVEVRGRLATKEISPLEGEDLVINLANLPTSTPSADFLLANQAATVVDSGFGKLLIKGVKGEIVASIDASGSALFAGDVVASGSGTFEKLIIASQEASQSGEIIPGVWATNASAGTAVLPAGKTEVIIYSPAVKEESLVYLTPLSSTQNNVLYVKAKKAASGECKLETTPDSTSLRDCGWFKVGVDTPLTTEVKFNWWIIDLRNLSYLRNL